MVDLDNIDLRVVDLDVFWIWMGLCGQVGCSNNLKVFCRLYSIIYVIYTRKMMKEGGIKWDFLS